MSVVRETGKITVETISKQLEYITRKTKVEAILKQLEYIAIQTILL